MPQGQYSEYYGRTHVSRVHNLCDYCVAYLPGILPSIPGKGHKVRVITTACVEILIMKKSAGRLLKPSSTYTASNVQTDLGTAPGVFASRMQPCLPLRVWPLLEKLMRAACALSGHASFSSVNKCRTAGGVRATRSVPFSLVDHMLIVFGTVV